MAWAGMMMTSCFSPVTSPGVSVTRWAPCPRPATRSQDSACVGPEWRGGCVTRAEPASLDSLREVAEVLEPHCTDNNGIHTVRAVNGIYIEVGFFLIG